MDVFTFIETQEISCLDHGFVRLVDAMPRLVPEGQTCESAIVRSARVSTGNGLKTPDEDVKLLRYLFNNYHTSPFESVKFTFHIRAPLAVRTHFIRHRTANINEFSQRYAPLSKISDRETVYFRPSSQMRNQSKSNKQSSTGSAPDEAIELAHKAEALCDQIYELYEQMLEMGVSREMARLYLPSMTYTEFYYTMDLNNLIKFLGLRNDSHTQYETRVFAEAMQTLITPLVPNIIQMFEDRRTK